MLAKADRPICRDCGERWSLMDVVIMRLRVWYAWGDTRRRVRAWGIGVAVYVVVSLALWPFTGYDPVTLHVAAWSDVAAGMRAVWDALVAWVASWM